MADLCALTGEAKKGLSRSFSGVGLNVGHQEYAAGVRSPIEQAVGLPHARLHVGATTRIQTTENPQGIITTAPIHCFEAHPGLGRRTIRDDAQLVELIKLGHHRFGGSNDPCEAPSHRPTDVDGEHKRQRRPLDVRKGGRKPDVRQ
ncbi:MAG: hypothetical protein AAGA48_35300 [Myxococcota bacterium]